MSYADSRAAPTGIKLLCAVHSLALVVGLFVAVAAGSQYGIQGFLVFLAGAAWLAVGALVVYGLWNLRGWGWLLAVLYFGVVALVNVLGPLLWSVDPSTAGGAALYDLMAGGYVLVSANHFE